MVLTVAELQASVDRAYIVMAYIVMAELQESVDRAHAERDDMHAELKAVEPEVSALVTVVVMTIVSMMAP